MPFVRTRERRPAGKLGRKVSRVFRRHQHAAVALRPTASSPPPPGPATPTTAGVAKLRHTVSKILTKCRPHHGAAKPMVDGSLEPRHRSAPCPHSALVARGPERIARIRSLFGSSSGHEKAAPKRKRSVRFEQYPDTSSGIEQLDGQSGEKLTMCEDSGNSEISGIPQSTAERLGALAANLNLDTGVRTVIHRAKSEKPQVPHIVTHFDDATSNGHAIEQRHSSPSTNSSATPFSRGSKGAWSPTSTASTGATSITSVTSPGSSGSRKRHSPEECQILSKGCEKGENLVLPPIQEDSSRSILIPVQEASVNVQPSVATVENAVAAKCAFETMYDPLFTKPHSPRSIRKKKFERYVNELAMSHDQRVTA
ncbi:hypothetical protein CERZMDRAFT_96507 [Cercospora zeae-maydis SCOH1-5]|uniref:Uncharacterized protein n=1 Tax=Cercospora zeae-maydis SCOH1-5 TaxID=717836 RepID=A0A6A6FJR8_9PEZI|nr:hypothetical protein CERZMDRAFT_96507 [Cercospora zeae-maydis SCOH1-5]